MLDGQRHWVTNLANAASLIYNSLLAFPTHFGSGERAVNWCVPKLITHRGSDQAHAKDALLLGPFCGRPACQFIDIETNKARGVCADAFVQQKTVVVRDVHSYPGHIACDGATNSEVVCPLIYNGEHDRVVVGVLDLDCLAVSGFDEEDKLGLESIVELIMRSCDW
ncbi:hypothetical protein ID866_7715 [Astraeus odoratus]|nr:hypothetical protein ID866_7715 [Astraeus odoratus]